MAKETPRGLEEVNLACNNDHGRHHGIHLCLAGEVRQLVRAANAQPATMKRLAVGWDSCCLGSEVVKTQFRVDKTSYGDEWFYMRDGTWKRVPDDTIHWGQHAPGGQATLFVYFMTGEETCFYPPQEGI
jgi:hypothetical protein